MPSDTSFGMYFSNMGVCAAIFWYIRGWVKLG
ncbi:hypothetical protein FOWG_04417 [Fusarium oxysporum f. sp. lycopersici MN25]|uniref:Uncharacterized protein n=1 Tax=Fusarium oxysporum Fo47 TaxID=660027 RepID=W9JLT0_FUSOX|nr:hypothetical protein FOZG_14597 [Fusarium oxysporum Fo47]EWZ94035.1 hypothetical protein FOWG_04417 [Fusarium oxysporum f. sp. lycopersici MN25]